MSYKRKWKQGREFESFAEFLWHLDANKTVWHKEQRKPNNASFLIGWPYRTLTNGYSYFCTVEPVEETK